ncbi:hypothetical protein E2P64_05320 [Candidatus Bathyarchaeota archaeon]|nr:hypothetical protein E2P64_05320 [Candidatus Bathyarchaeota archaeon]
MLEIELGTTMVELVQDTLVGEVEKLLAEGVVEYIQVLVVVDKVLELVAVEQLLVEEVVDNIPQVVEESCSLLLVADIDEELGMILREVGMHP